MGLLDKLKNVFFEEEEEVIEVPVKKERIAPVAKKIESTEYKKPIVSPVVKEEKIEKKEDYIEEEEKVKIENDFKFPVAFDDKDFTPDVKREEKKEYKEEVKKEEVPQVPQVLYKERVTVKESSDYLGGREYTNSYESTYQGLYEGDKKEKKTGFTRSPIISPVYGILDKNYKKEEIVTKTKKEVRLSVTTNKKVDLDSVREKAYGDLVSEITESMTENVDEKEEVKNNDDNLLYDLSEDSSPSVKVVTVGDAEEYYSDLGLEYNVDYKVEKDSKNKIDDGIDIPSVKRENNIDKNEDTSNLFDLIDSMYEEKEW